MLGVENRKDYTAWADVEGRFITPDYPISKWVYGYAIRTDEPQQGETQTPTTMESTFNHAESTKYIKALYHLLNAKVSELKSEAVFEGFSFNPKGSQANLIEKLMEDINIKSWYDGIIKEEQEAKNKVN